MKMSDWFLSTVSNKDVVSKTGFSNRILENPLRYRPPIYLVDK